MFHWIVVLLLAIPVYGGETLDSVSQSLSKAWSSVNSLSFRTELITTSRENGVERISKSSSICNLRREGGKWLVRLEDAATSLIPSGNVSVRVKSLTVYDGTTVFLLSQNDEAPKTCTRMKVKDNWSDKFDEWKGLQELQSKFQTRWLPDETIDGVEAYVLEATKPDSKAVLRYWYDKKSGIFLRLTWQSGDGKLTTEMKRSRIEINQAIDPKEFVFTPPPGVPVEERSFK